MDAIEDLAIQPDGKIIAAGESEVRQENVLTSDIALVRYNPDGSLDRGFGTGGKVLTDIQGYDRANALALQRDGKIVVAGVARSGDMGLARYNANGTLDAGFGHGGTIILDLGGPRDEATGIVI